MEGALALQVRVNAQLSVNVLTAAIHLQMMLKDLLMNRNQMKKVTMTNQGMIKRMRPLMKNEGKKTCDSQLEKGKVHLK